MEFTGTFLKDLAAKTSLNATDIIPVTAPGNSSVFTVTVQRVLNLISALTGTSYKGIAEPSTNPGDVTDTVFFFANTPGTYTYFKDDSSASLVLSNADVTGGLNIITNDHNVSRVDKIPIDLSNYVTKAQGVTFDTISSTNILNPSSGIADKVVNSTGGLSDAGTPGTVITVTLTWGSHTQLIGAKNGVAANLFSLAQYNSSGTFISGSYQGTGVAGAVTKTTGAATIKITYFIANVNQLNWGSTVLAYEAYFDSYKIGNKDANSVAAVFKPDISDSALNAAFVKTEDLPDTSGFSTKDEGVTYEAIISTNIIGLATVYAGKYVNSSGGLNDAGIPANYTTYEFTWGINTNLVAALNGAGISVYYAVAQHDSNGVFISGSYQGVSTATNPLSKATGAAKIRFTVNNGTNPINQVNWGSTVLAYEAYYYNKIANADANGNDSTFKPDTSDSDLITLIDDKIDASRYTYNNSRLVRFRNKLINSDTGLAILTLLGDSWTALGYYPNELAKRLYAKYGFGGAGYITFTSLTSQGGAPIAGQSTITRSGTWTYQEVDTDTGIVGVNGGQATMATGAAITIVTKCTTAKIFYKVGIGSFTYSHESLSPVTVDTSTGAGVITLSGMTDANHTFVITATAGTPILYGIYCIRNTGVVVNNCANGGSNTADWNTLTATSAWKAAFTDLASDGVIIMHGTNDQNALSQTTIETNWQAIIDAVQSTDALLNIILMSPGDNLRTNTIQMSVIDALMLQKAKDNNLMFLSNYKYLPKDLMEDNGLFTPDNIHYLDNGYKLMADFVFKNITVF
ncbi:MAG: hypothetical protein ACTHLB_05455 [Parafilimonas sp.]